MEPRPESSYIEGQSHSLLTPSSLGMCSAAAVAETMLL